SPTHIEPWTANDGLHSALRPAGLDAAMTRMRAPGVEERARSRLYAALGFFTIGVVAGAQALLDPALPIDLLYVVPVAVIAMTGGRPSGLVAAAAAAVIRSAVESWSGAGPSHAALVVLGFVLGALVYGLSAWFAAEITSAAARARAHALTDPLTGLGNRRFFEGGAGPELDRPWVHRRARALADTHFDRFVQVNGGRGHGAGVGLLRMIADEIPSGLRRSDLVARVGCDEFAILLPETPGSG